MDFTLLLFVCISSLQVIYAAPPVEVRPQRIIHLEGETLTAMCRVGVPISYCRWTVPGVGGLNLNPRLGPHEGIKYQGRSLENGECGISIQNVREKHNGILSCNLGYATEPAESTGNMTLVIAKAPRAPQINVTGIYPPKPGYPPDTFQEGETIRAECRIEYGRPVANISWFIGTEPIYDGLSSPVVEDVGPQFSGQKTIRQTVTRLLKYSDNGKDLRCVAGHIALGPGNINHSIYKLNVYFPPKPKSREIEQFGFTIGQPGKVIVTFHANPLPNIEWLVDGHRIQEGARDPTGRFHSAVLVNKGQGTWDAVLNIAQVTSEEVEKSYTLTARNRFGQEQYRVAISTSPAPPADITAGAIAGIVIAALLILLLIFILIFARATGRWCFAGSVPAPRQGGESSASSSLLSRVIGKKNGKYHIGSLTYKDYKLVETADGRKSFVPPELEKQMLIEKKIKEDEATFENEVANAKRNSKRKPSDSTLSHSSYETPIQKADSTDLNKSEEFIPKPIIYKTFDDLQKESTNLDDGFIEKRHTYPFSEKKPLDILGDEKANPNLPPPLKPFDTFSEDGEQLKMPPHIKSAESESEVEKEEFKPETPVKPLSFDWVFKKKKADNNTDPAESEERKEAKNIIKNIFSKPNEEAGTSDSDTEKQDEPRKSSALKFPNIFGLRSSKKEKLQQEDKGEKLDKPDIKIDDTEEKVEPLQEYKDGEWVDVPSEFSKREEKSESTLKKLLGINNKNEDDKKEHADDEEKEDHKRLPSLRNWLKNRSKQDEIVNDSGEAEEKDKSDVDDVKKIEDKPEDHTRLPSLKKWLKNRSKQEEPETKTEDIKTEDVKEEPEIKEEPGEIKEEQPKKSSVFRIGKYFGKTEDKAQTKEDKSDTSDSESDSDVEQEKKRTNFKKWLAQSKGKAKAEKEPKSKSSDSESDSDTEEVKKQNKFKRWLGSGRKSKSEAKVESEDSFKKEMQQTNGRELEDKILEKTDDEGDKVSEFTSGSQEELAKPETIAEEPEKEDSSKLAEKKDENKRTSRRSMNVPPPLPPNPPPLPLIPPTHSFWGPKSKKGKNRASNRQSNSSISSSSKESILNPDSDKKDDARPRTWKLLDDPEKIEVLQDEKEHVPLEESTKDQNRKKGKKSRPVSFADNVATVMGPTDTESADHGSADKSSVSKLTNEKQSKKPKLMSNLIDSFKKKNRDKVADNEGSRGTTLESNKDPEQLPLDGTKTEGIVYAELDIARGQGNVMRRDDDKTEYAEIIHPKQADHKKSKEELRKSRENLSGSREHLTEPEGEPKKEATV